MVESIKIGPLTFVYWVLALVLTASIVFLGIVSWDILSIPFVLFFAVPAMLSLAGTRLGLTKASVVTDTKTAALTLVGLLCLFLTNIAMQNWGLVGSATPYDNILIAALFAIYEETLFLSVAALLNGAQLPSMYNFVLTNVFAAVVFIGLHALRYPAMFAYDIFLFVGRAVLTGVLLIGSNSDVPYSVHIIYNVIASW